MAIMKQTKENTQVAQKVQENQKNQEGQGNQETQVLQDDKLANEDGIGVICRFFGRGPFVRMKTHLHACLEKPR
jgi:hypothetical protein